MKTLLLAIVIVGVSVVLLGVRVFFVKGGTFPNGHIGGNAEMSRRGIHCAHQDDQAFASKERKQLKTPKQ